MVTTRAGKSSVLLEVCVESVDDAVAAVAGGADRIELNFALALDGLTPSHGLLSETRRAVRVPLVVMARPRAGDFCYADAELRTLRRDVDHALGNGADGVAFGVLTPDARLDVRRCRALVRAVASARAVPVFHRAFDALADPSTALEQLIDLGVRRVMTAGGRRSADAGAIARLVAQARGRIEILPAGGIRPGNVRRIVARTGCDQVHSSVRDPAGRMSAALLRALVGKLRGGG